MFYVFILYLWRKIQGRKVSKKILMRPKWKRYQK